MENVKIKTELKVSNEVDSEIAEMFLYGTIRQSQWWDDEADCISANRVKNALKELKGKAVNVHINSGGGDVFESIAICSLLKQHDKDVNIYIDAMAGSGASVIATAGKNVYMFDNAMQMIHKAWTYVSGNSNELRKAADDLDKIDTSVKASYMSKFVGTEDELEKLIADESYLTATECLAFGLCTEILTEVEKVEVTTELIVNNIKETLFNKYKKEIKNETPKTNILQNFNKKGENI